MKQLFARMTLLILIVAGCTGQSTKEDAKKATGKGTEIVEGVGEGLKDTGNKTGKALGEGLGAFFSGVGEGVEKTVTTRDIRISEDLKSKGVSITVTTYTPDTVNHGLKRGLSLYVLNKEPITGTLRIKFFNESDQEIGRATAAVTQPADDAKYIQFLLDKEIPVLMTKYIELDLKAE